LPFDQVNSASFLRPSFLESLPLARLKIVVVVYSGAERSSFFPPFSDIGDTSPQFRYVLPFIISFSLRPNFRARSLVFSVRQGGSASLPAHTSSKWSSLTARANGLCPPFLPLCGLSPFASEIRFPFNAVAFGSRFLTTSQPG